VWNSNLGHLFGGSHRDRELSDLRATWERTEAAVRASPIAATGSEDPAGALALEINKESWARAGKTPAVDVAVAVGHAIADLLDAEDVGALQPAWPAIEADVSIALEFREALTRRSRYATDFAYVHGIVRRQVLAALSGLYAALPESCFSSEEEGGSFEVPLIELVEDPAELIRQFLSIAYAADAQSRDLFKRLRDQLRTNVLVASGLDPTQQEFARQPTLLTPADLADRKTPAQLADLFLANTPFRKLLDVPVPFRVSETARFEHCHIVGGTGHGKTQLMQRLIHADLVRAQTEKRTVVVIDSQGDLINRLSHLDLFDPETPNSLADRVILIDPADVEFPPALNLFDAHLERLGGYSRADQERVLNGVVEVYENFFGELLGAELTQKQGVVFKYLARLMLVIPGATIHTLIQLMDDPKPYLPFMGKLEGSARYFFETEFFEPSFAQTKRQIQRRLWGVLSTPAFERMFAQARNKLDLFRALQDGSIVLISTAKDLLKEEGSQLFGRFFIGMLSQATLERATLDPEDRTPTAVYVDEAQEYFDDSVETILNQARKYRVGITMAHQAVDQLSPRLRSVIHANTSMKCAGGVSAKDARALAEELHTSADFLESMRRRDGRSEFGVWIRNQTPRAIRLTVPLGFLERQPIISEAGYERLLADNQRRYCGTIEGVEAELQKLRRTKEFAPKFDAPRRARAPTPEPPIEEVYESEPSEPVAESIEPEVAQTTEFARASEPEAEREPRRPPPPPTEPGKGGPQHKYMQQLLRTLATERGFRAILEEQVPGGQVDVGLHRDDLSIACEISVTSTAEYEAQNLAKCLRAGFVRVWAIVPNARRKKPLRERVAERLGEDVEKVEFLTLDEAAFLLDQLVAPEPEETIVRGYKVKSSRKVVSPEEAAARRAQIARILATSDQTLKS
jgi:hypothetical protein